MEHFSIQEWVDFIRGLGDEPGRRTLQAHLDDGCADCGGLVRRLEKVAGTVRQASSFPVPRHVLFRAYSVFPYSAPEPASVGNLLAVARQIFDSWAEPGLPGVRSAHGAARQLSFRSADIRVELSIEFAPKSTGIVLAGQVHHDVEEGRQGLTVKLMAGQRVVSNSTTNEFGEFVLKGKPAENAHLSILDPETRMQLLIPIPEIKPLGPPLDREGPGLG